MDEVDGAEEADSGIGPVAESDTALCDGIDWAADRTVRTKAATITADTLFSNIQRMADPRWQFSTLSFDAPWACKGSYLSLERAKRTANKRRFSAS
jgi:hypothetical protein